MAQLLSARLTPLYPFAFPSDGNAQCPADAGYAEGRLEKATGSAGSVYQEICLKNPKAALIWTKTLTATAEASKGALRQIRAASIFFF